MISDHQMNGLGQPVGEDVSPWSPPDHPTAEAVDGRFCRLEPLSASAHGEYLYEANARDETGLNWTYLPYGPFAGFDDYLRWLVSVEENVDPQFYAVLPKEDGVPLKPAGVASYLRIKPAIGTIEVGHIHFSEGLKRSTAATEAMYLMMQRAFALGYRRYEWKCDAFNAGSRAAAERLGFSFEGIFRQATVYKGRNRDTAWYAVIDKDWPNLKDAFDRWLKPSNFDENGKQKVSLRELMKTRPKDS